MSTFLFGGCCCGGCNCSEQQSVIALMPFWFGYIGVNSDGGAILNPVTTTGELPGTIWRTYTNTYLDGDTDQIVGTGGVTYSIYGKATLFGDSGWPGWVVNRKLIGTLSDPYTWEEANTNALTMLAMVTLLNPAATYGITTPPWGHYIGDAAITLNYNFCYPSESASYGSSYTHGGSKYWLSTSVICVYYDTDGGLQMTIPSFFDYRMTLAGYYISNSAQNGNANPMQGWVICQKNASKTMSGFTLSKTTMIAGGGTQLTQTPFPGEYILDPSDVGGYGIRTWFEENNAWQASGTAGYAGSPNVGAGDTNSGL